MKSMLLKIFGTVILSLLLFSCNHPENTEWAKQGGGESYDGGRGVTIDSKGNVYVVGRFQGSALFDDKTITGNGDDGVFLVKYNPDGKILWAKASGGKKEDSGYSIDLDSQENIYITGYFADTASFDTQTIVSKGESDAFLAKYDTAGNVLWVKQAGGAFNDVGRGVGTDDAGNSYMVGFFSGTIYLDSTQLKSDGAREDIFISSYDSEGKMRWAKKAGGTGNDKPAAIAVDKKGDFFITGFFDGTAAFDSIKLISDGLADVFTAKFDKYAKAIWANQAGGSSADEARGIAIDEQNNVYATGFFNHEIKFNGAKSIELSSKGECDVFVVKYDVNGVTQWAQQAGGQGLDQGSSVTSINANGCLVTGFFEMTANFGDSLISSVGNRDVFVAHYNSDGKLNRLIKAGSNGSDEGRSVKMDNKHTIYLTGNYQGKLRIGTIELPESRGDGDVFISKITNTYFENSKIKK